MNKVLVALVLILAVFMFLQPQGQVLAYSGGLLEGKALNFGNSEFLNNQCGPVTKVTDHDPNTYVDTVRYQCEFLQYKLPTNAKIVGFRILGDIPAGASWSVGYRIGTTLSTKSYNFTAEQAQNGKFISYIQDNVSYVQLSVTGTTLSSRIYEFDVFTEPSNPVNLQAIPGDAKVTLTWNGGTYSTGYNIKRSITAGGPYTTIASNVYGSPYIDTTVTNNTTYHYVITAVNDGGESGNSNEVSATPQAQVIPAPEAPLNLTAQGGNSEVTLSWDSVTGALSYNVKRSITAGGPYISVATNVNGNSFKDTSVTNGTTYYYVVTATNEGGESANSNEALATPIAPATNRALLVITLTSGLEKEYDLSIIEVNNFISWYNNRATGAGQEVYTINKTFNMANFLNRKDYIAFSKIETFEVSEYTPAP